MRSSASFSSSRGDAQSLAGVVERAICSRFPILGRAAHARALKLFSPSVPSFLCNHLINLYAKLDLPSSASTALSLHPYPSVVSFTSLIAGLVQNSHFHLALSHFLLMLRHPVRPNDFTLPCLLKATASISSLHTGRQLHSFSIKCGLASDVYIACSVLDMYSKCSSVADARKVFVEMPHRTIVAWNAAMTNAVLDGRPDEAVQTFIHMRRAGERPDSITLCASLNACAAGHLRGVGLQLHGFTTRGGFLGDVYVRNGLIDFYGKCHDAVTARKVFDEMTPARNNVSWCSMIAAYAQNGREEDAFEIFQRARREGWEPTHFMVSSILTTCCGLSGLDLGRSVHALAVRSCIDENVFVGSALVDMYGKCGSIREAELAFARLPDRNLITWNSMIGGYAQQGEAKMAIFTFKEMVEVACKPNYVTFVNVMAACSRGGFVEEGMEVFREMKERYGVEPHMENYSCVVDMLGRAGRLDEALEFLEEMPVHPTASAWGALLGGCKVHGRMDLGRIAAERLFLLDPRDSGNHVLLSNMLASSGRWEEAVKVRKEMEQVGIKKEPGCSWVTWKNTLHVFQAKDTSHERNGEIQAVLTELKVKMKASGYVPDTQFALFDLEEEEKENEVFHHSEKLALAFGLICIPHAIPIRITKNLRVCGDCHSAIKFVSSIVDREIVLRDNSRFHHFKDGRCSCGDYW